MLHLNLVDMAQELKEVKALLHRVIQNLPINKKEWLDVGEAANHWGLLLALSQNGLSN